MKSLLSEWDSPGVYILFDRHSSYGTWIVSGGEAPAENCSQIKNLLPNEDHWNRAILIMRDITRCFNSSNTFGLDGRLLNVFNTATDEVLHNVQRPGDDALASYDLPMLESAVEPVSRPLINIGHHPSTTSEQDAAAIKRV